MPALLIGPPPARQLAYGLLVSLIVGVVIVALGVTVQFWTPFVLRVGRLAVRVIHLVRAGETANSVSRALVTARDRVATSFEGQPDQGVIAAAATRMLDFAALVAALTALGAHAPSR